MIVSSGNNATGKSCEENVFDDGWHEEAVVQYCDESCNKQWASKLTNDFFLCYVLEFDLFFGVHIFVNGLLPDLRSDENVEEHWEGCNKVISEESHPRVFNSKLEVIPLIH